MNKITQVSSAFRITFQIIFCSLLLLDIIGWYYAPMPLSFMDHIIHMNVIPKQYPILHILTPAEKLMGFIVSMIPTIIQLSTIYFLIKLFQLYEKDEFFSANSVSYFRKIGYTLLLTQLIQPLYEGLMGIVITLNNPHGHRFASITLDQTNFGIILMALLVILISWIMAEGCKLREEQQLVI